MENINNKNGKSQQNGLRQPLEELVIPERLSNFALKKVSKSLFHEWRDTLGCTIRKREDRKVFYVILNGNSEEENNGIMEEILDALKVAENAYMECDETERFGVEFKLIHRMLIPSKKCGYVVGKGFQWLKKIKEEFNLQWASLDRGKDEPIPKGFECLKLHSTKVEELRQARKEICLSIRLAMDINSDGPANGKKRLSGDENLKETIKIPTELNQRQKEKYQQILEEFDIEFKAISNEMIELSGKQGNVIEAKRQLASLMNNNVVRFETPQKRERLEPQSIEMEILVPFPNYRYVLGQNGDNIKSLKTKFGVNLIFLGDNCKEYPDGRTLRIVGDTEDKVKEAKTHIEENYCKEETTRRWQFPRESEVQKEMTLPELVVKKLDKVKINNRLNSYAIYAVRSDGCQRVIIKGTRMAVEAAEAELEEYCKKLANNNGEKSSTKSSSKSGSDKSAISFCWEEKENEEPEIVMDEEEKNEESKATKSTVKSTDEWYDCPTAAEERNEKKETTFGIDSAFDDADDEEGEEEEQEDEEDEVIDDEEEDELEEELEDDEEEMKENGNCSAANVAQNLFEKAFSTQMAATKYFEKAYNEIKKEAEQKNSHIRLLEKRILTLEQRLAASELKNGK